jgi:hypothetical protein
LFSSSHSLLRVANSSPSQILEACTLSTLFNLSQVNQNLYTGLRLRRREDNRVGKLWDDALERATTEELEMESGSLAETEAASVLNVAFQLYSVRCQVRLALYSTLDDGRLMTSVADSSAASRTSTTSSLASERSFAFIVPRRSAFSSHLPPSSLQVLIHPSCFFSLFNAHVIREYFPRLHAQSFECSASTGCAFDSSSHIHPRTPTNFKPLNSLSRSSTHFYDFERYPTPTI